MNLRSYMQSTQKYSADRFVCPDQAYCNNGSILADDLLRTIFTALSSELQAFETMQQNAPSQEETNVDTISLLSKQLSALEKKEYPCGINIPMRLCHVTFSRL